MNPLNSLASTVTEAGTYAHLSASGLVKAGPGILTGVLCSSSSSGTMKVWEALTATGLYIQNTMPLVAGQFYPMLTRFDVGVYITLAGTCEITVFYA